MKTRGGNVLLWGGVAVLLYLAARLHGLTAFPIFSDEAIYIHWAQIIFDDAKRMFVPLVDGKQPLFMWLNVFTLPLFSDPLVSGRVASILAGLASLAGIYFAGRELYSEKHGLTAAVLYVLCPYAVFFDRLALVDSLLCALGVWTFYVSLRVARQKWESRSAFAALGVLMGLAFLTKATALLLMPVPLFVFLLYGSHKREGFLRRVSLSYGIACVLISPLFFSAQQIGVPGRTPVFHKAEYFLSLKELLSFPWAIWRRNAWIAADFFAAYLTPALIWVLVFALFLAIVRREKEAVALAIWAAFPTLAIVGAANGFFSRYFLIAVPPLMLLAATAVLRLTEFLSEALKRGVSRINETSILAVFLAVLLLDGFFLPGNSAATR